MGGKHEMSTEPGQPGTPGGPAGPAAAPGDSQPGAPATDSQPGAAATGPEPGAAAGEGHAPPRGWRVTDRLRALGPARLAAAVAIAAAAVTAISLVGASSSATPSPAAPAKPFTLGVLGHPARHLSLASLAGRPVIVNFFASWCAPCQRETPLIASYYRSTHGHPVIIGIDVNDSPAAALAFVHRMGVRYPLAADPLPMKVATAWDLPGLPATFFLDSRHRIVKRVFGPVTRQALTAGSALATGRAG